MTSPLVSIIIPAHNAAPWLGETLASVLAQDYPCLEAIIVDDGSVDETRAIAETAASRRPDRLRVSHQPNAGAAAARNHGAGLARGDFIKFLDADDLLSPDAVGVQVSALIDRPLRLAYGSWGRFYSHPSETRFIPKPGWHDCDAPVDWICETWSDTEPMYQCGLFLISRELLAAAGGWDERLSLIDDFEFFTRLVLASDGIIHTPAARLRYRSGMPGSLSAQKSRKAWESAILSTSLAIGHLRTREDSARTRRVAANMLRQLVFSLYPKNRDMTPALLAEIGKLGGGDVLPGGGRAFRLLARLLGWRAALFARGLSPRRTSP